MKCTDKNRKVYSRMSKRRRRRYTLIRLMRRILILLCLIVIVLLGHKMYGKNSHYAADYETDTYNTNYHKEDLFAHSLCVASSTNNNELSSVSELKAYGLFDVNNMETCYDYQVHDKIYPASTTKILTALVALEHAASENISLNDVVTISKNACSTSFAWDEQTCGIKQGDTLTLEDLLYGLLLYSGNDTAVAIAEYVGGNVDSFAEMMNAKAHEIMATNSHFTNPSGLYDDDHYTTAYDLYLIFNECVKHEEFVKIISADSYTAMIKRDNGNVEKIKWEPTNFYALGTAKAPEDVTISGGKTGTLKAAGNCLILLANNTENCPFISIIMGAETKDLLYKDMTLLLAEIPKIG